MKELCLEHAIEGVDRFPTFGEAVPPPARIKRPSRDLRLFATPFLIWVIWAVGVVSMGLVVSFAHDSKTQADSWLCKRQ
jgi:hypothetical protein